MWGSNATDLIHPGGLAVALVGFGITRFVVAGTLDIAGAVSFAVNIIPLVVGLAFTVYGVVLAVGDLSDTYVNTVTRWTLLGVSLMIGVLALTAIGSMESPGALETLRDSRLLVANALLGGAVGGALTGDRAGLNRRHRDEIELQAELALVANGLLRHEVLNATSIIDGYASLFTDDSPPGERDVASIREATDRIETTVADVGEVGRARDSESLEATRLGPILRTEIEAFDDRHPDAAVTVTPPDDEIRVLADHRLRLLVRKLLETVGSRVKAPTIRIDVAERPDSVGVTVQSADTSIAGVDAPDDPAVGFDRRIVELVIEHYDGTFEFSEVGGSGAVPDGTRESGLSATLEVPRAVGGGSGIGRLGVSSPGIAAAIGSGLVAGIVMGFISQALTGLLPVIGSLYGVSDPLVGWITHLFHSVVFALLFAAGYTHLREQVPAGRLSAGGLLGAGWGIALWFVAAGVIMPLWLRLLGDSPPVPNLAALGLLAHVVWGVTVGLLYRPLREWLSASGVVTRLRVAGGRRVLSVFR
jgi:uncharacterized membrane protein YagU involved in acid resistance